MHHEQARDYVLSARGALQLGISKLCLNRDTKLLIDYTLEEGRHIEPTLRSSGLHARAKQQSGSQELRLSTHASLAHSKSHALRHELLSLNTIELVLSSNSTRASTAESLEVPIRRLELEVDDSSCLVEIEPTGHLDAILIDNDRLVHKSWGMVAKRLEKKIYSFFDPQAFYGAAHLMPLDTPVYIDLNLEHRDQGDVVAAYAYLFGFRNIHIRSGVANSELGKLPWLTDVQGKTTPWELELSNLGLSRR